MTATEERYDQALGEVKEVQHLFVEAQLAWKRLLEHDEALALGTCSVEYVDVREAQSSLEESVDKIRWADGERQFIFTDKLEQMGVSQDGVDHHRYEARCWEDARSRDGQEEAKMYNAMANSAESTIVAEKQNLGVEAMLAAVGQGISDRDELLAIKARHEESLDILQLLKMHIDDVFINVRYLRAKIIAFDDARPATKEQ